MSKKKIWLFADGSQAEARVVAWRGPVVKLKEWFQTGEDVHTNVARLIARFVQDNRISMPGGLFTKKHWSEYSKGDEERQISKTTVHANNYGMGKSKFALVTGLPESVAKRVQDIYFELFPDVKSGYQSYIEKEIKSTRTLVNPFGFRRTFYGRLDEELLRSAYSAYAQTTIGDWLGKILSDLCTRYNLPENLEILTPAGILSCGEDVAMQIHDAVGVRIEDDEEKILDVASFIKKVGEEPFLVNDEPLTIPVDFKIGPSWGDVKDYKMKVG